MKSKAEKRKQERRQASVRELLGIEAILKDGTVRTAQGELVFFLLKPTNIAVLSDANTEARVMALADVLKGFPDVEMLCLNSREDFEANKRYLAERIAAEPVPQIRILLEKDHRWLDTVQSQMATAREFALVLRMPKVEAATNGKSPAKAKPLVKSKQTYRAGVGTSQCTPAAMEEAPVQQPATKRTRRAALTMTLLEKNLKGCGFAVRPAGSQEIKRLLAVYFAQNVTTERFEDYDGQRFEAE